MQALRLAGLGFTLVVVLAFAGPATPASSGVTFRVNSTLDKPDTKPGNGICDANPIKLAPFKGGRLCTLRAAVQEAEVSGGGTIDVPAGKYRLTIAGANEDLAATGDLDIWLQIDISGAGPSKTIIDGGGLDRVLDVQSFGSLKLTDVTIRGGVAGQGAGGGVRAAGELILEDDVFTGNSAYTGAAVSSDYELLVTRTTFQANTGAEGIVASAGDLLDVARSTFSHNSLAFKGVISNEAAGAVIRDSTFDGNSAPKGLLVNFRDLTLSGSTLTANDGGIENIGGTLKVVNSTVAGNQASIRSGGLYNYARATLVNDTFSGNGGPESGNLTTASSGQTTTVNTIFAASSDGPNCSGATASLGHNIDDGASCGLTGPGDRSGVDPMLDVLRDNGGPTQTQRLLAGSPAIDTADTGACPSSDQRGVRRPAGAGCDIGSVEFASVAGVGVALAASSTSTILGQAVTYTATVTNKGPDEASNVGLTNTLVPASATVESATPSSGSCTTGPPLVCTLGSLPAQASAAVTFAVTPTIAGSVFEHVSAHANEADLTPFDNSASVQTAVVAPQSAGATGAAFAKVVSLRAWRSDGRARVEAVFQASIANRADVALMFGGQAIASTSAFLQGGRQELKLVANRQTPPGTYVLRGRFTTPAGTTQTLTVHLGLR